MNNHRLSQLLAFYEEDPTDPFNLYALALEYREAEASRAEFFFQKLLREFPDYLPTYYPAAQFFAERDDEATARVIFENGIRLAANTNQEKTGRELQAAYQQWQDEWE
jgi:hypothetical protein